MQWRRRVPDEFFPCLRQRIGVSPVADDAAHFERSTLARKDRTELAAIADPESFFEELGLQIETEIDTLAV